MNIEAIQSIIKQSAYNSVEEFILSEITPYDVDEKQPDAIIARNTLVDKKVREEFKRILFKVRSMDRVIQQKDSMK